MTPLRLAQFEILEPIGRGGMGIVYRARDRQLGRIVAIKVLPASFSDHPDRRSRFLREAQAAANLNHPNIATVHHFGSAQADAPELVGGEEDGGEASPSRVSQPREVLFLVMEYVAGEDLNSKLDRGALPLGEALRYGLQIAEALETAHAAGVIHRDLKPNNVRITPDGQVKILDFGLAKVLGGERTEAVEASFQTTQGMVMGTPPYMAPEQLRGTGVDARCDLYSLGVVLYQMISGHQPYPARNILEYAKALARTEPKPLSEWNGAVTPEQEAIVHRLMAQETEQRPQSAGEVVEALLAAGGFELTHRAAHGGGSGSRSSSGPLTSVTQALTVPDTPASGATARGGPASGAVRPWWRRWPVAALLALVILAAAGVVAARFFREPPPNQIGVTPFTNVSGEPTLDALAESLTTQVTSALYRMPQVQVISPSIIRPFFERGSDLRELSRKVGAGGLLTGSVQSGSRSYVELADSRGVVIWNGAFPIPSQLVQRDPAGLGNPELDMVGLIQLAVEVWLDLAKPLKASDFYLEGEPYLGELNPEQDNNRATALFEEAVRIDPNHASALAALSSAYLHEYDFRPEQRSPELLAQAEEYARRALAIDESMEIARISLARIVRRRGDLDGAREILQRVVQENPASHRGFFELGITDSILGEPNRAVENLQQAVRLNQTSWVYQDQLGVFLMDLGRFEEAEPHFKKAVELSGGLPWTRNNLGGLYIFMGRFSEAKDVLSRISDTQLASNGNSNLGTASYYLGQFEEARKYFQRAVELEPETAALHRNLGDALAHLDEDKALDAYRQAADLLGNGCTPPRDAKARQRCALYNALAQRCTTALDLMKPAEASSTPAPQELLALAQVNALCRDPEGALPWIERALSNGIPQAAFSQGVEFRKLRQHSGFKRLMEEAPG